MSERPHRIDISNTARESRAAVTRCVQELTWTEETRKLDPNAELVWIDRALPVKKFYLQRLGANRRTYQRANRFFGMDSVVTKCSLAQSMDSLQALQSLSDRPTQEKVEQQVIKMNGSSHTAEQYLPRSWCLPQDIDSFENTTSSSSSSSSATCWYIAKPDRGRCGRGIALFSDRAKVMSAFLAGDLSEVGDEGEQQKKQKKQMKETQLPIMPLPVVVQEYIPDPLLYRDTGCKFDLRVYVIIKSLSPLDVYVFDEALVRVASTPYEAPTEMNCATATMHLTNSHINSTVQGDDGSGRGDLNKKEKKEGVEKAAAAAAPVLKHCMTDTLEWISKKYNVPADEIWTRVKHAVATSVVAVYPLAAVTHATCFAPNSEEHFNRCFQLLGIDILLDSKLQPWILEINNSPSLNLSTEADIAIKVPLVKSMLEEVFDRRREDEEESKKEEESKEEEEAESKKEEAEENKESKKEKSVIPRFQKLDVTTTVTCKCEGKEEEMPAVLLQSSILNVFLKICGWKESSCRPVKSAMPSKDVCSKLMKNGISLPSRQELSLNRFTRWVAERAAGESSSIMIVLESIEEALL